MLSFHTHPLNYATFDELTSLAIRHGIFSKQQDNEGFVYAASNEEIFPILEAKNYCDLHQLHSTTVRYVTQKTPVYQPGDGLHTQQPRLALHIRHSDCQAAIFYDKEHHAIANVHSGWRGLLGNIYAVTVAAMKKTYNTHSQDLLVFIGPSLGPDHAIYSDYLTLFPTTFYPFMYPKNHFDFRAVARKQLRDLGISNTNIVISDYCTYTEHDRFFSSRYQMSHPNLKPIHPVQKKKNNVTAVALLPRD
ncbi:peptidoglycan editing factor PgeF [Candidatus Chlamydia sanziniae]|uniref:Purine nucleoside phosphorylase n=1 Tax=Candidatus Chlamydia sanziniae TaxID=1806891 RepID=A0A1A9HWN6_9CHLA|nr:peptidoglycan editing factor PgeF [Candidatus Chlamydia sanziniae]ANH79107.1 hypothetical protein Cs308_0937 [Candidatus Chlamydia sanziniae]